MSRFRLIITPLHVVVRRRSLPMLAEIEIQRPSSLVISSADVDVESQKPCCDRVHVLTFTQNTTVHVSI